uniref:Structural maintenance of chromosomes protein n=1 Tax=Albugo laibachii Nc14 TaxID=890382 RepID=F0WMJ9_9STRA|nr:hypothetical protein CHGG_09697 [Albugo laibachii Nc14]|eukprot:CCA22531.1 hypothetical protein CHGG_09697 [Albugo laibachii Nc14]
MSTLNHRYIIQSFLGKICRKPRKRMNVDQNEHVADIEMESETPLACPNPTQSPTSSSTRLVITKMQLENFKSYAGIIEIGPFHNNFSAVVGPNGSGKSNVIDAMLFVFGKRASKLRLKKISELIHRSEQFPNLETASVTVFFHEIIEPNADESDENTEIVLNSEFNVTRTASHNCNSKYFVNGTSSSFTKVTNLLRAKGIDLDHNRFLILQGEVEQIAMMKSKGNVSTNLGSGGPSTSASEEGLLEYLEDIIGSNKYIYPIEEAWEVLEKLNERRSQKLNRVRVSEQEKEHLEVPRTEALAYLRKEREIYAKENILYQLYIHSTVEKRVECEKTTEEIQKKYKAQEESINAFRKELEEAKETYQSHKNACDLVVTQLDEVKAKFATLEKEDVVLREDLKCSKEKMSDLQVSEKKETKSLASLVEKRRKQEEQIPMIEKELETLQLNLKKEEVKVEKLMDKHKNETNELRHRMEEIQHQMEPFQAEINQLRSVIDTTTTEIQLIQQPLERAQKALESNEKAMDAAQENASRYQSEQMAMRKRERELEKCIEESNDELHRFQKQDEKLYLEYRNARTKAEEVGNVMSSRSSRNRMLTALLDASKPGNALADAGLRGRLGDLGAIDTKYDVAISTACSALDNLVVESTRGAQQCVEFLRRNNLGRATFIILEQLKYLHHRSLQPFQGPRNSTKAPRLYDLVRIQDEKYRVAFYFALRDTLVASDLDQATPIAYQGKQCRYRVVTLDGQMVELSGAMSGGGNRARSGGMSSSLPLSNTSQEECTQLEEKAAVAHDRLRKLRDDKASLEHSMDEWCQELERIQNELPKVALSLQAVERQIQDFDHQKKTLKKELERVTLNQKSVEKSVQDLEEKKTSKIDALRETQEQMRVLEDQVDDTKEKILQIGGVKAQQAHVKVKEMTDTMDAKVSQLTKARVELKSGGKTCEKLERSLEKLRVDQSELAQKMEQLRERCAQVEETGMKIVHEKETLQVQVEEKQSVCRKSERHVSKIQKQVEKLTNSEIDLQNEVENARLTLEEHVKEEKYWKSKLASVQAKFILEQEQYANVFDGTDDLAGNEELAAKMSKCLKRQKFNEAKEDMENEKGENEASVLQLPILTAQELAAFTHEEVKFDMALLTQQRDALKENVNMQALVEYQDKVQELETRASELEAATLKRDEKRLELERLQRKRLDEFMKGFGVITMKLKEMYQMITLGGDAELELVDSLDPFSEGIVFSVRPFKKSWKPISNLSGGEKTLASLALVFALHHYKPTPLYVMDEIDAALDYRNVSIVGNYIKERTRNAQFIIISLRNNMFELADRLVGIYKTDNTTKSVTINPKAYQQVTRSKSNETPNENKEENGKKETKVKRQRIRSTDSETTIALGDRTNR